MSSRERSVGSSASNPRTDQVPCRPKSDRTPNKNREVCDPAMTKLLLFSDLHLDSAFAWMAGHQDAARRQRQALRDTLRRIIDKAVELEVDALLCGGDLYEHDRFTPDTAAFLKSEFEWLQPIRVYIAPGNHDWYGPQSLYRSVEWSKSVHVFNESHLLPVKIDDGLTLWGAAHTGPSNTPGFLDNFRVDCGGVNLALFHGSERGWFTEQGEGKTLHAPFDTEQIARAGIDHAFLGHYHNPKDDPHFTYPGNPDPLSFGEDGERGIVLASVHDDGSVQRERFSVTVSEVHDIDVDISGCANQQDIRGRVEESIKDLAGVARVTLKGELDPNVDCQIRDLQSLSASHNLVSTFRTENIHSGYDFEVIKNEPTVRGKFVTNVMAADLPEEEKRKVLITGLRALDGRRDLEVL